MKWKLIDVIQETDHPFLNFFTLHYEVENIDGSKKPYSYYMASRNSKEELLAKTKKYDKPSGVMMAIYRIEENGEHSFILTTQFRPPMGAYMTSIPAGLVDKGDLDYLETAKREAKEEAGCEIEDIELLSPPGASSSGMSDETNAMILARASRSDLGNELEEFEDIDSRFVTLTKIKEMMDDPKYHFPLHIRLLFLYLLERFKK